MKLIHAILWCFGFSVVEDNTTTPQQTMPSTSNTSTSGSVDVATVFQDYTLLTVDKQFNHDEAWAAITDKYKWTPQQAQDMLIKLSNHTSNMGKTGNGNSVTI